VVIQRTKPVVVIQLTKPVMVIQCTILVMVGTKPVMVGGLTVFQLLSILFFLRPFLMEHTRYICLKIPRGRIPLNTRRRNSRLLSFHEGCTRFLKNYFIFKIPYNSFIFHDSFFVWDIFYSALSFN